MATRIRAETQIRRWFHTGNGYLLVFGSPGPFSGALTVPKEFYQADQIAGLDRIPEREVKSIAEARKIWGCPPVEPPSRYERMLEDDDV